MSLVPPPPSLLEEIDRTLEAMRGLPISQLAGAVAALEAVAQVERRRLRVWRQMLETERDAIIAALVAVAESALVLSEAGPLDAYSFDWFETYGPGVIADLKTQYERHLAAAGIRQPQRRQWAQSYAEQRAHALLDPDGAVSISDVTRRRVLALFQSGATPAEIQQSWAFSEARQAGIAEHEARQVEWASGRQVARYRGNSRHRIVTGSDNPCEFCETAESEGWISIDDDFDGVFHVGCQCSEEWSDDGEAA